MNKYSLKFKDEGLENKFQNSISHKILVQCKILTIIMILEEALVSINALVSKYYLASGFLSIMLIVYIGFFILLQKYPHRIKYGILWFNNLAISLPIALQIYIWLIDVELTDKLCVTLGIMNVIPQFVLSQNVLVDSGLYVYTMIMISISFVQLMGFSWFIFIPPMFTISWICQKYETIRLERFFFSESQTNECLATVLKSICKERIMIFTYDHTNIRYQEYLLNDECVKFLNNNQINQILTDIHVIQDHKLKSMSQFIFQQFIQTQHQGPFDQKILKGYYKDRKNKIQIDLNIQNTSKTFFTIKIETIQKTMSKGKIRQFYSMQSKFLHKLIPKYLQIFQNTSSVSSKVQQFYDYLNQQLQWLRLHVVTNSKDIKFEIHNFDIIQQLRKQFDKCNKYYVIMINKEFNQKQNEQIVQVNEIYVENDSFLITMLFQNLLLIIKGTNVKDLKININITQSLHYLHFEFIYPLVCTISTSNYNYLIQSLIRILSLIGIHDSLQVSNSYIKFTLISQLDIRFL